MSNTAANLVGKFNILSKGPNTFVVVVPLSSMKARYRKLYPKEKQELKYLPYHDVFFFFRFLF